MGRRPRSGMKRDRCIGFDHASQHSESMYETALAPTIVPR